MKLQIKFDVPTTGLLDRACKNDAKLEIEFISFIKKRIEDHIQVCGFEYLINISIEHFHRERAKDITLAAGMSDRRCYPAFSEDR